MAKVVIERRESAKTGRVSHRVRFVDPNTLRMRHHGTYRRRQDAVRAAAQLRTQLDTGQWFDDRDGRKMTFRTWCTEWADRSQHRRTSTAERDALVLRTYWEPELGDYPLAAITPFMVSGVVAQMQKRLAPATVRTNVEVLTRVMRSAVEHRLIATSPVTAVRGVQRTPQRSEGVRFLNVDELYRLADCIRPEYRAAVFLAGVGGLRWSETAGLRRGAIDFEAGRLNVTETTTETVQHELIERSELKSNASRRWVPLVPMLRVELRAHLDARVPDDPDALVIVGPDGGPPLRSWFRARVLQPAVRQAGLDGMTYHALRHTAAGLLISSGAHPEIIRRWLGHADIRTTMRLYGRTDDSAMIGAANAMQALLER